MSPDKANIFNDLLQQLGVRHTESYSARRFRSMPFPTLYGLTKLMQEYGICSQGLRLSDKTEIRQASPPFIAGTSAGFVIVTSITTDTIGYLTHGVAESAPIDDFLRVFDGNLLLPFPAPDAVEPSYGRHHALEIAAKAKRVTLWIAVAFLFLYLFVSNRIYAHASTVILTLLDLGGLYISYLLLQKSLNIHNSAADKVCGVIQSDATTFSPPRRQSFSDCSAGVKSDSPIFQLALRACSYSRNGSAIWLCATSAACRSASGAYGIRNTAHTDGAHSA